ncbi:MAG: galactose-1-phosphate uridylyltransferase [Candidatus Omnitrophota bacterium]|jgi:UDPglucose--hexose-1-phosphate uridylyltransferase
MSELRYNMINREWVVIASDRAKRPKDFIRNKKERKEPVSYRKDCPFCPGNEALSPEETFRLGDEKGWGVRCIPNKFPALSQSQKFERHPSIFGNLISGFGAHEVVIEHPRHDAIIALMSDHEVEDIIRTYKNRYEFMKHIKGVEAVTIFKNHGPGAGTSQEHPHSQIIATPIVPPQIRNRLDSSVRYFDLVGECIFCQSLDNELKEKKRVIMESEKFVAFLPFAGASPFITWIFPRRHMASFSLIDDAEIKDMARSLKFVLSRLYYGLDNPDFNYTIRSIPVHENDVEYFHWYLSIVPRISQPAGFELGSGMFINASVPEESAEFLRNTVVP